MNENLVVHCKKSAFDVYVGRPSKWGNPFAIGKDGTRADVIAKHREWLLHGAGSHLLADIGELRGKRLACWCSPAACHADTLVELANR